MVSTFASTIGGQLHSYLSRVRGWCGVAVGAVAFCGVGACGASPVGGPDPVQSTYFKATMIDGGTLPYRFLFSPRDLADTYFTDARLVPLDFGRTTDARIFNDRAGSGSGSGNGRDTTVSTGRMSDIRTFSSAPAGGNFQTDSVVVDVVRVGDILYITRPHPDPTRNVTDTAHYVNGVLVRPLGYWRTVIEVPTRRLLTYTTVR